ncbi:hypothetical protein KZI27_00525 (plasmid) [Curtobacterium sp. TC1]|uniref:hypothetical protein n=1 Tax=Curtobacterium sp. TC1 TaxID=2862880 RepID=UPI001C9AE15A|nr:hypothetical protein [Curtobacterium sp. TC1]QZQ53611.1 hypothetical protein KZI27_00525 [Curtobacterium sp. TC1]
MLELLEGASAPGVRRFDVDAFVQSNNLLELLSKDDVGSAGALLTTLIGAICKSGNNRRSAPRAAG